MRIMGCGVDKKLYPPKLNAKIAPQNLRLFFVSRFSGHTAYGEAIPCHGMDRLSWYWYASILCMGGVKTGKKKWAFRVVKIPICTLPPCHSGREFCREGQITVLDLRNLRFAPTPLSRELCHGRKNDRMTTWFLGLQPYPHSYISTIQFLRATRL